MNSDTKNPSPEYPGHPTPMTARVLAQTGGWPATIHEEYEWMIEDEAEVAASVRERPENESER